MRPTEIDSDEDDKLFSDSTIKRGSKGISPLPNPPNTGQNKPYPYSQPQTLQHQGSINHPQRVNNLQINQNPNYPTNPGDSFTPSPQTYKPNNINRQYTHPQQGY